MVDSSAQWDGVALPAFVRAVLDSVGLLLLPGAAEFHAEISPSWKSGRAGDNPDFVREPPGAHGGSCRQGAAASGGLLSEPLPGAQQAVCDLPHRCLSRCLLVQM